MAALDRTGDGRLRCHICSRISPSFFPNCFHCGSDTFVALQVESHPILTENFFQNHLESQPISVQRLIYEKRAKELISSFQRKGFLLQTERKVIVHISIRPDFECSQINTLLARDAIRHRFVDQNRTFMLRPRFVSGAPPNSTSYLLSCPRDVTATQIASTRFDPPRLIPPVASMLQSNNIPPVGMSLFCSICKLPKDDVSIDEMDEETDVVGRHSFRVLNPCSHIFHATCISNWFQNKRLDCPQCRYIVLSNDDDFNLWASLHNHRLPVEGGAETRLEV